MYIFCNTLLRAAIHKPDKEMHRETINKYAKFRIVVNATEPVLRS